jgi:hypothetical protein
MYEFTSTVLEANNYQIFKINVNAIRNNAIVKVTLQSTNTGGIGRTSGSYMLVSVTRVDGNAGFSIHQHINGDMTISEPVVSGTEVIFGAFVSNNGTGVNIGYGCRVEVISSNPSAFTFTTIAPGTAHSGTANSNTNRLFTSGSERMRITSAGDVGIGTTTPGAKLEVNGTVLVSSTNNLTVRSITTGAAATSGTITGTWTLTAGSKLAEASI